jgi:hypothetical protein
MDVDVKGLRQRCEARLRALDLPNPLTVRGFCDALAERRGRRIELCPVALRPGPSGGWVAGAEKDYVLYQQETTPVHQEQIILHEASHIACGHRPLHVAEPKVVALLFPDIDSELVQGMLQRTRYSTEEEQEAEMLASLLLDRVTGRAVPREPPDEVAGLIRRLVASLEDDMSG